MNAWRAGRRGSGSGCGDGVVGVGAGGSDGGSDVEERWDVLGRATRRARDDLVVGPMPLMGAGCVLRAIRTESGDMRCDGQEDRRTGTMLVTQAELRASIGQLCARQQVRCGPATTPGDMLLFAWPSAVRPVRFALCVLACGELEWSLLCSPRKRCRGVQRGSKSGTFASIGNAL